MKTKNDRRGLLISNLPAPASRRSSSSSLHGLSRTQSRVLPPGLRRPLGPHLVVIAVTVTADDCLGPDQFGSPSCFRVAAHRRRATSLSTPGAASRCILVPRTSWPAAVSFAGPCIG